MEAVESKTEAKRTVVKSADRINEVESVENTAENQGTEKAIDGQNEAMSKPKEVESAEKIAVEMTTETAVGLIEEASIESVAENQVEKKAIKSAKKTAVKKAPRKFKKAQLLVSKQFEREEKYFLEAILHEDQEYTIKEAQDALSKTLAKGVK